MGIATADDTRDAIPELAPAEPDRASASRRSLRPYGALVALALLGGGLSLTLPSTPNYDPWAWIIWGREIVHGHLVTTGGPTWKPLPMIFTTLAAPFGSAAPDLWLAVARAGALLSLVLAFLVAYRLTRRTVPAADESISAPAARAAAVLPPLLAGAAATAGMLVLSQYVYVVALGYSEGLLISLVLLAVLRHLDGAPRQSLAFGFAASLDRPEVWPLLGLYAIWLWRHDPSARRLIVILLAALVPIWLVPELLGSGSLLRGVRYAMYPRGAGTAKCPFCAEVSAHEWPLINDAFRVGAVLLLLVAASWLTPSRDGGGRTSLRRAWPRLTVIVLLAAGLLLFLEDAVLTEIQFSGSNRYLFLAAALVLLAGAVGWGAAAARLAGAVRRAPPLALIATTAAAVAGFLALSPAGASGYGALGVTWQELHYQGNQRADMTRAVRAAGGVRRLAACGRIETNPQTAPFVAWVFGRNISDVAYAPGRVLIETRANASARRVPATGPGHGFRLVATTRTVRILTAC
jgi:hypothetical protein